MFKQNESEYDLIDTLWNVKYSNFVDASTGEI